MELVEWAHSRTLLWKTGKWGQRRRRWAWGGLFDQQPQGQWGESSVQFSRSVVSISLRPHGWQHARPPYLSPTPGVYSNSCPLSRWCHPTISSSVIPFPSYLQSFPAPGSFPMSQLFWSSNSSIGASESVLPMNIQGWFPLGLTGLISLQSTGLSRVFSSTIQKHQFFGAVSHICTWLLEKPELSLYGCRSAK